MRGLRSFLILTCMASAAASDSFAQDHFCACMIGNEPILRDFGLTVYAYTPALGNSVLHRTLLSARVDVEKLLTDHGLQYKWDLVSSAVFMQCRFLQAVGAAAVGTQADFSASVRKGLVMVPLHDSPGQNLPAVFLFLNPGNPEGARLVEILAGMK